ncbi:MAG: tetratricopeptide repeat protein [Bacteroidales bacterium]|nr:tetratricopeptide repeat protein [Bacteroidales bacterium]
MRRYFLILAVCLLNCLFFSCHSKKDRSDFVLDSNNLASLNQAIQMDSLNPELYYLRANYYYNHKAMDSAGIDVLKCIELKSSEPKYYVLLSDVNFAQRHTDDAEENLLKALDLDKNFNEARLKLAELYYFQKDYERCTAAIDEAAKLQPHNPTAYLIKAFCYKEQADTSNYLRMLYLVKDQNPEEIKAHLELGYFCQKRLDPAGIEHYKNALRIDPRNQEINYNLGVFYRELGDAENARAQFENLLSFAKDGVYAVNAYYNLGYILMEEKKFNEAVADFSHAIALDTKFVDAYAARGECYEYLGDVENARADYEKCLTLVTNYQRAIDGLNALDKKSKK